MCDRTEVVEHRSTLTLTAPLPQRAEPRRLRTRARAAQTGQSRTYADRPPTAGGRTLRVATPAVGRPHSLIQPASRNAARNIESPGTPGCPGRTADGAGSPARPLDVVDVDRRVAEARPARPRHCSTATSPYATGRPSRRGPSPGPRACCGLTAMVRPVGLEPTTSSLKGSRSTIELRARGLGAANDAMVARGVRPGLPGGFRVARRDEAPRNDRGC